MTSLSLVIPTFNERENIGELLSQLAGVLPADSAEIIFVDDSTDDTPEVIAAAARTSPVPVRLHHRRLSVGGLGTAVVEGMRLARGEWIVVMDADLQHPPKVVPELLQAGIRDGSDLVVASRYTAGGGRAGLANAYRRSVSKTSTWMTKALFGGQVRRVSDPMSGFFAVRATSVDVGALRPLGFKVLLDLVVRTQPGRIVEVPYEFASRHAGDSKSSLSQGLIFLRHLLSLRFGGRRAGMVGVGLIGSRYSSEGST
jgi:dolichol-phosphate mannosyltransferase